MPGPLRTVRTQIARSNPRRKKPGRRAGGRGYERGRSPQGGARRGIRVGVDGDELVLEACAHRALIVRGGES